MLIFETRFIFPAPRFPAGNWHPQGFDFEDVDFRSEDRTRLHGWFFPHRDARFHLLYCHGNADFVPRLGLYADALRRRFRCSVFVFDYRGYGKSRGKPNEEGILADGKAACEWLERRNQTDSSRIVALGRSLGGAVAVDLAVNRVLAALLVESTFTSIPDVVAGLFPRFLPLHRFLDTQLNSLAKIGRYRGPLFLSHGDADDLVPFDHGERLYAAAGGPKQFFRIPGGTHDDPQPEHYFDEVDKFLERNVLAESVP